MKNRVGVLPGPAFVVYNKMNFLIQTFEGKVAHDSYVIGVYAVDSFFEYCQDAEPNEHLILYYPPLNVLQGKAG